MNIIFGILANLHNIGGKVSNIRTEQEERVLLVLAEDIINIEHPRTSTNKT